MTVTKKSNRLRPYDLDPPFSPVYSTLRPDPVEGKSLSQPNRRYRDRTRDPSPLQDIESVPTLTSFPFESKRPELSG